MAVAASYQRAREYRRTQVETARPTQLVLMLYDGAIRFLALAREQMPAGDLETRHDSLLKAQRILSELISTLDREKGGEVAANLQRLYSFMLRRLVEANLKDSPAYVEEVAGMLRDLRESWAEVDRKQAESGSGHGL